MFVINDCRRRILPLLMCMILCRTIHQFLYIYLMLTDSDSVLQPSDFGHLILIAISSHRDLRVYGEKEDRRKETQVDYISMTPREKGKEALVP